MRSVAPTLKKATIQELCGLLATQNSLPAFSLFKRELEKKENIETICGSILEDYKDLRDEALQLLLVDVSSLQQKFSEIRSGSLDIRDELSSALRDQEAVGKTLVGLAQYAVFFDSYASHLRALERWRSRANVAGRQYASGASSCAENPEKDVRDEISSEYGSNEDELSNLRKEIEYLRAENDDLRARYEDCTYEDEILVPEEVSAELADTELPPIESSTNPE